MHRSLRTAEEMQALTHGWVELLLDGDDHLEPFRETAARLRRRDEARRARDLAESAGLAQQPATEERSAMAPPRMPLPRATTIGSANARRGPRWPARLWAWVRGR